MNTNRLFGAVADRPKVFASLEEPERIERTLAPWRERGEEAAPMASLGARRVGTSARSRDDACGRRRAQVGGRPRSRSVRASIGFDRDAGHGFTVFLPHDGLGEGGRVDDFETVVEQRWTLVAETWRLAYQLFLSHGYHPAAFA